jgi:hypothetical protein
MAAARRMATACLYVVDVCVNRIGTECSIVEKMQQPPEGGVEIGDRPVIVWTQTKADALDPFNDGLSGFFDSINR